MLDGEIEYRRGNYTKASEALRQAVHFDDSLQYTEPWGWMVPTRHAYAALLLEQGHVEEAAQAYAEDLGLDTSLTRVQQHPNDVWALHGYHACLQRLDSALINGRMLAIKDPNTNITLWESGAIIECLIAEYDPVYKLSHASFRESFITKQWLYFQSSGQGHYYGQAGWLTNIHPEKIPSAIENRF
ncbi:hypothetical protein BDV10DRAFT_186083 [Aspergillus recurvatus]